MILNHVALYELKLPLDGALRLTLIYKPPLIQKWPIQIKRMPQNLKLVGVVLG